jgi:ATP-dependent DNA helicase RecG
MEQAVAVMRESAPEPRADGKACPLVGAVLWTPAGATKTASRGELRLGDHAEHTLLERKNRDQKLDGSILFATLEPCAPGARKHPKLGCAERIVNARIKEVYVGITDPDPTVDRKGIKYLEDSGIVVHMFDRDLQDEISTANKDFIAQALERAAEHQKAPAEVKLSSLEDASETAALGDLSPEALELYRDAVKVAAPIGSAEFNAELTRQRLLTKKDGLLVPTRQGLLLFGREPRTAIPQAGLLATIHYPDGTHELENFEGPMVLIPNEVERWLRNKMPNVFERNQMQRQERPALPFEMVREAVVNALVHRDYDVAGAKIQLEVTANTITVKSPGGPISPITLKQLQDFNAPVLSRNPEVNYVFAKLGLAEERGFGLRTLKLGAAGLPLPTYAYEEPYLKLTLYRNAEGAAQALPQSVIASMNEEEAAGWSFITEVGEITASAYAQRFGFDDRKAQRHIKRFVELGILRKVGAGRATKYQVARV